MITNWKSAIILLVVKVFVLTTSIYAFDSTKTSEADTFAQILSKRFSGYSFDPTKPVTHEQLKLLAQAAQLAPSSYNEQPWNFIICDKNSNPADYNKAFGSLVEFNQNWAKNAPVLIVSIATTKSIQNGEVNRASQYDTGAAAFSMMLQATALGLMTHQMGGYDEAKLRQALNIPEGYVPMAVMAVGYASTEQTPPERKRKSLKENFFAGSWGKAFE